MPASTPPEPLPSESPVERARRPLPVRVLALLFGLAVYLYSVRAVAYMIGFLANVVVPKTVDSGVAGSAGAAIGIDAALLLFFAVPHSLMARGRFKRWLESTIPPELERSVYSLVASLTLSLTFWQWRPLPQPLWHLGDPFWRNFVWGVFAFGWLSALASTKTIGHFELFGLRQAWSWFRGREFVPTPLRQRFLYRFVRHPVYSGFLIGTWVTPDMTAGHALFAALSTAYIVIGMRYEERDLLARFGERYREYQRQVPALFPRLRPAPARDEL